VVSFIISVFLFFHVTATPEIYTLSLHDALPISRCRRRRRGSPRRAPGRGRARAAGRSRSLLVRGQGAGDGGQVVSSRYVAAQSRSEEHTSELQSRGHLVCRLLLEKKKKEQAETN